MAKLTLNDITNLQSEGTAVELLNQNSAAVETAMENTLSRDGTTPNTMGADLDMNSNRILNLPQPTTGAEPARWSDLTASLTLTGIAVPSLSGNAGKYLTTDGSTITWSTLGGTTTLLKANNLSDLASAPAARTNLGLGTSAIVNIGTSGSTIPVLSASNTWSAAQIWTQGGQYTGSSDLRLSYVVTSSLSANSAGFRGTPMNVFSVDHTFVLDDAGRLIRHDDSSSHTFTIPPNSSVPFPNGTTIVCANIGAGALVLARGMGVSLRIAGSGTSANHSLAQYGLCTLLQVQVDVWIVSGAGLT